MAELFGFNPSDWLDEGFNVELRFAAPPDEALLTRLGKAAGGFRGGSLGFAFTGPFAVVSLLPHPGRERAALDELAALLSAQAGDALLEGVVLNAVEQPEEELPKSPGPALPGSTRPVDPSLAQPQPSPVLEAAKQAVNEAAVRAQLDKFLEAAKEQPFPLTPIEPTVDRVELPAPLRSLDCKPAKWLYGVFWLHGVKRIPDVEWPKGMVFNAMIAVRGHRALLDAHTEPRRLFYNHGATELLVLEDGAVRPVYRMPDYDQGFSWVHWIDDGHVVIGTTKRTVIVALESGAEVAASSGGGEVSAAVGGRVMTSVSNGVCRLLYWDQDKLTVLARYSHPDLSLGPTIGDLPTLRIGDRFWTTTGLKEAVEKLQAKTKKGKAKKAPARRSKKPTLEPMPIDQLTPDQEVVPFGEADIEAFAAAGFDVRPQSKFREQEAFVQDGVRVGICSQGVAVQRPGEAPRVVRWTSSSGSGWQLTKLRLKEERLFATHTNDIVEAHLDDEALVFADSLMGTGFGYMQDIQPQSADRLLVHASKGVLVLERHDGKLTRGEFLKVSKPYFLVVAPSLGQALILSEAKQRVIVASLSPLKKLAAFTEDIYDVRISPDGWHLADPRRNLAWRVTTG